MIDLADPMAAVLESALYEVLDPETGVDVVDLGLIYDVRWVAAEKTARVVMTLTTRACPMGEAMVAGVRRRLEQVAGVSRVEVELTFEPPWTPERISEAGREALGS
jgi:metal-sulfur cluster biosynthetic enzyme